MDTDEIDEGYSLHMAEYNKKFYYCKVMCQFKLVFDSGQHSEYITAGIFDNRTRIWWKEILNGIISDFSNFGHKFDFVG